MEGPRAAAETLAGRPRVFAARRPQLPGHPLSAVGDATGGLSAMGPGQDFGHGQQGGSDGRKPQHDEAAGQQGRGASRLRPITTCPGA